MSFNAKTLFAALAALCGWAYVGPAAYAQATSTAVPFLLISPQARSSAMGEAGVAIADDASAVFWNPAGLAFQTGQELTLSHANWLPQFQQSDLFYEYANYKMHMPEIGGTLGAGLTFLNLGKFERRSAANDLLGEFTSFELAIGVNYGTRIDEDLGVGVGLRLIHSSLSQVGTEQEQGSGTATTVAGDVGVMYRPSKFVLPFTDTDIGKRFALGASITNMGPSISYIDADQADPLPTAFRVGVSYDLVSEEFNRFTWTVDVTKLIVSRDSATLKADNFFTALTKSWDQPTGKFFNQFTIGTGVEYWYSQVVALRFGFFHEDPSYGNRRFLTFGAGVRYDIYAFDFSYLSADISNENSPLAGTLRFTLGVNWDRGTVGPDGEIPADDAAN